MVAKRRRHQFQMYKHQVQWCGPNLLELGGGGRGGGQERQGGTRPGIPTLKAEGRKCGGPRSLSYSVQGQLL